jgi:hypothetical protein
MKTPLEYLKEISPDEAYGIREQLIKLRLVKVVCILMIGYAKYYHIEKRKEENENKL